MTHDTSAADRLRSTVGRVGLASATDGELIRRYADHRDDLAFAELVHRFAPAVYALCRRHLPDPGTADDAFQAVFVLLARKASGLTHPDRVGGWLVGTADRIARTARRRHLRRSDKFRPLDSVPEPATESAAPSDLRVILDDELAKLPPHYRTVVLLCDVDGVSRREAAARLNIPTATLGNRLTRARAVLGRRLLRRGVLVAAGAVVSSGSVANPPARLLASAVRVALTDTPPTELLSLLTPEIAPMPRGKLLLLLVVGLVLAGGVTTGVVLFTQKPNTPPTSEGEPAKPTPPSATEPAKPTQPQTPPTMALNNAWMRGEKPQPAVVKDTFWAAGYSPNGKWMVALPADYVKGAEARVIDTATWKESAAIDWKLLKDAPGAVAVSDDGKRLFMSFANSKPALRVWDVDAKRFEDKLYDTGGDRMHATRLQLSSDGKTLAAYVFGDNPKRVDQIRLWDAATGTLARAIDVPPLALGHLDLTDGGKTAGGVAVRTADWKSSVAEVREWDVATGTEKRVTDLRKVVETNRGEVHGARVLYTPDGKQAVVAGGYTLPKKEGDPANHPASSGSVWVIDRESGKLVKTLIDRRRDLIRDTHITADGKKLIVQPTLTSRLDREFDHWGNPATPDAEFVELQQWDVATWERDWVKIVPAAERWKLWNGAAK